MDFGLLCPEVNSGLMYTGPGAGTMLAAAAGWAAVAAQLESTAGGYSAELAGLTGRAWSGPSSMMMAAAATPYVAWLQTTAAQAAQTAAQAYGAAAAYEAAFAMTVPPPAIAANRAQLTALIATNFFGQNTPAIAATEAQYMEMWAQDATAMYVYAADSSTLSSLTPFHDPPRTTNEAGPAAQARSLAFASRRFQFSLLPNGMPSWFHGLQGLHGLSSAGESAARYTGQGIVGDIRQEVVGALEEPSLLH